MKKRSGLIQCSLIALHLYPATAVSDPSNSALDEELKFLQAESYVITASKVLEHKDRSISTVSVITQDQIRALGAKDLQDVLNTVPGINTTQSSLGAKKIGMRGIISDNSEKVLILLNGHPLDHNLTNGGSTNIYDTIALDNVKRIEIVRGPGSLLYGANALLGTINIITKHADDQSGNQVTATGGSFGTQQYNVYSAGNLKDLKVTANANVMATDGINRPLGNTGVNSNLNSEKYDFDLNLDYQDWNFTGHFAEKKAGSFAGINDNSLNDVQRDYQDYFFILGYKHNITDKLNVDLKGYHDNFNFDNIIPTSSSLYQRTGITSTKSGGEAQFTYQWFDTNQLIVGFKGETQDQFDISHTTGSTPWQQSPYSPLFANGKHRTLASSFVEDIWDVLPNLRLSYGARYDRYSDFGNTFNPRAGFNWEFSEGYILRYSYGTAFRAPTFGETDEANPVYHGNNALRPEMTTTNELGFTASPIKSVSTGITVFESDITNLISCKSTGSGTCSYFNQGTALSRGIELEAKYHFMEGSYLAANFTLQNTIDGKTLQPLTNVPKEFGNVMWNQQLASNYSLMTHVFIKGQVNTSAGGTIASYAVLNSTLQAKELLKNLNLSASVYNWLDSDYFDPSRTANGNYYNPGRSVFIRADYKF